MQIYRDPKINVRTSMVILKTQRDLFFEHLSW